jgi:hypothetical protein
MPDALPGLDPDRTVLLAELAVVEERLDELRGREKSLTSSVGAWP